MDEWFKHWLWLKFLEQSLSWYWKRYGRAFWEESYQHLFVLVVALHLMYADLLDWLATHEHEIETVPATMSSAELEELHERVRVLMSSFAEVGYNVRKANDRISKMVLDGFKVPLPTYEPPRVTVQPTRVTYRPMTVEVRNGLPYITLPKINFTPMSFKFSPGGFRFVRR